MGIFNQPYVGKTIAPLSIDCKYSNTSRIATLDTLRGIAALAVCWYHFTNGNATFLPAGALKLSGAHGGLGVEIFFVISGFIIPYSMFKTGYKSKYFCLFVLKRIIRLDPPYILSIVVAIVLGYISSLTPGFRGKPYNISITQVLLHLGYVNVFFGYEWLNPVFWTLAIEFQYYILIGLVFPLIGSTGITTRVVSFVALGTLAFLLPAEAFIFHYLFLFLMGILTFYYWVGLISKYIYPLVLLLLICGSYLTLGPLITIVGGASALVIAYISIGNSVFNFMGNISYSLYLFHVSIGGKIINLSVRFTDSLGSKIAALVVAVGMSIIISYCLYRFVEKPAQKLSSSVKYLPNNNLRSLRSVTNRLIGYILTLPRMLSF